MRPICIFLSIVSTLIIISCASNTEEQFRKEHAVKAEKLVIYNTSDTLIFGNKGTAIFFEKNSFEFPDGSAPTGEITLELKEFYEPSEMILNNLSTTSNGRLLITGGMIELKVFADGRELQMKPGKEYILHFPMTFRGEGPQAMNLFYGERNESGQINWSEDTLTLLVPTAHLHGWNYTRIVADVYDTTDRYDLSNDTFDIYQYFREKFDQTRLTDIARKHINKALDIRFELNEDGTPRNILIQEETYDSVTNRYLYKDLEYDPYLMEFARTLRFRAYDPIKKKYVRRITEAELSISFQLSPGYKSNEEYNQMFRQKYGRFKDSSITSINEAELRYFILSASKFGWINCDIFLDYPDEKVNFYVDANAEEVQQINIVFKDLQSIMSGQLENGRYVFSNVPLGEPVKIVALSYKGKKPLMAISETEITRAPFGNLSFKEFSINDLQKELDAGE